MSVAKISDIVSELTEIASSSLNEAIEQRIAGGNQALRDLRVWWVKEKRVSKGALEEYQVSVMIGFVIK